MKKKPTVLLIMDGFGLAPASPYNAISVAKTPNIDRILAENPHTELSASGEDVGLPAGQIGNSEVGHTNIGAGRVVYQDLPRINNSIADGSFFENQAYSWAMDQAAETGHPVHILGLLSDGGVHSHINHLFALLEMAQKRGVSQCYVHAFLDGRDVSPTSGVNFVKSLQEKCEELGYGCISTIQGRFWGMDRDRRWERIEKGYRAIVCGEGMEKPNPVRAVEDSYDAGVTDEFVEPIVCDKSGMIQRDDSVIFLNFRPDRAREMTWALTKLDFDGFVRPKGFFPLRYVCTAQYDETMPELPVAFPPEEIRETFGQYLSEQGMTQMHIAETEKYAHVTFFFNGGVEQPYSGEDRILIPSPKEFPTYDLIPEMSARQVTEAAAEKIISCDYDAVIVNLANCDMVGHTGVLEAAIKAVETVDACVAVIEKAVKDVGGILLIIADHGNADCMRAENGEPHTAHTTNPVPFILIGAGDVQLKSGRLADIAPTMLALMGLEKPVEMTGDNLVLQQCY